MFLFLDVFSCQHERFFFLHFAFILFHYFTFLGKIIVSLFISNQEHSAVTEIKVSEHSHLISLDAVRFETLDISFSKY